MNSPLTYPDQPRDDNLVEFFLKLIGAFLKKSPACATGLALQRPPLTCAPFALGADLAKVCDRVPLLFGKRCGHWPSGR